MSTHYAKETVEKLCALFDELKEIARHTQVIKELNLSEAEFDFLFSTGIITTTMTDQCATQKKALRILSHVKEEKLNELQKGNSKVFDDYDKDLHTIDNVFCMIHMMVNTAVGFESFVDPYLDAEGDIAKKSVKELDAMIAAWKLVPKIFNHQGHVWPGATFPKDGTGKPDKNGKCGITKKDKVNNILSVLHSYLHVTAARPRAT